MILTSRAFTAFLVTLLTIRQAHAEKHHVRFKYQDLGGGKEGEMIFQAAAAKSVDPLIITTSEVEGVNPTGLGTVHEPPPTGSQVQGNTVTDKKLSDTSSSWCDKGSSIVCYFRQSMDADGTIDTENPKFVQSCLPDELVEGLAKGDVMLGDHIFQKDIFYRHGCCLNKSSSLDGQGGEALGLLAFADAEATEKNNRTSELLARGIYKTHQGDITPEEEGTRDAYGAADYRANDYLEIETSEELNHVCPTTQLPTKGREMVSRELRPLKSSKSSKSEKKDRIDVCQPKTEVNGVPTYVKKSIQSSKLEKKRRSGVLEPGDFLSGDMDQYFLSDDCEVMLASQAPSSTPSSTPSESKAPSESPSQASNCMSLTAEEASSIDPLSFCSENNCCSGDSNTCIWEGHRTICEGACNGSLACFGLGENAVIGPDSCNGSLACYELENNAAIGPGSCNDDDACFNLGEQVAIGSGSCNGSSACYGLAKNSTIGVGSCNDADACFNLAENADIGRDSCNGNDACYGLAKNSAIGPNSCNDDEACFGVRENADIGSGSCNSPSSCYVIGKNATIGPDSCNGESACKYVGDNLETGPITIGAGACNGDQSCDRLGLNVKTGGITIGDNACIGNFACDGCKDIDNVAADTKSITCEEVRL